MTLAAARDLASLGIWVVPIAPGVVDTPMMAGFTEEIGPASPPTRRSHAGWRCRGYARLVKMVIEHDYLNGETIRMDGALRMAPRWQQRAVRRTGR